MALSLANVTMPSINSSLAASKTPAIGNKKIVFSRKATSTGRTPKQTAIHCSMGRHDDAHAGFPSDFVFGAASSAFQVEGATKEGGRGPSIWDTFCEKYPDKIVDKSNGEPGAGSYWHYKEDVKRLADLGTDVYRFSISWARILPNGRGKPNEEGIQYYNNLIKELQDNKIQPFVTLFHWDVPQSLEDEYGGFLSKRVVEDFKYFVDICFANFGDKVKHWITINEALTFCVNGYESGVHAPGHCTPGLNNENQSLPCPVGDSLREPYIVGHNILLAHAEAVQLYKDKYKAKQGGKIGITLVTSWFVPYDDSNLSREAQKRAVEFNLGWFMDPLKFGDYPFSMRSLVRERLPKFTAEESKKLIDSYDFIGLNYYTARYAQNKVFDISYEPKTYSDDMRVNTLVEKNGIPIGYSEEGSWVNVYPRGIRDLLLYTKERYNDPEIYITENGVMEVKSYPLIITSGTNPPNSRELSAVIPPEINDIYRSQYQDNHLQQVLEAIRNGVRVKGYFVWSLLDSFEWNFGYTNKFGLHYVNTDSTKQTKPDFTRVPKRSANWYKWFLGTAKVPSQAK
ncbi:hypothetical protein HPP92_008330 [Vanilla planifolia]|uniref:Beta-glucosidase n=1 Tax=Vanilla planifolia TaxID=51239 RepID=A0A835V749_VANPL|nr:hypothetical protein HPP92_008330 [Vanilla planifolia]